MDYCNFPIRRSWCCGRGKSAYMSTPPTGRIPVSLRPTRRDRPSYPPCRECGCTGSMSRLIMPGAYPASCYPPFNCSMQPCLVPAIAILSLYGHCTLPLVSHVGVPPFALAFFVVDRSETTYFCSFLTPTFEFASDVVQPTRLFADDGALSSLHVASSESHRAT